jgi:hypothetical protein
MNVSVPASRGPFLTRGLTKAMYVGFLALVWVPPLHAQQDAGPDLRSELGNAPSQQDFDLGDTVCKT